MTNCTKQSETKINLAGKWNFAIDSSNVGIDEKWYERKMADTVKLPGSMAENNKGYNIDLNTKWIGSVRDWPNNPKYKSYIDTQNVRIPFALQPRKKYHGAAWYQKEIVIPDKWANIPLQLFFERCHWESTIWIDTVRVGMKNSLSTPHLYKLMSGLPSGKHTITIRVDNRIKDINPGKNSHSITDHTQTNWNGITGAMYLQIKPEVYLQPVRIYPDVANKKVRIEGEYAGTNAWPSLNICAEVREANSKQLIAQQCIVKDSKEGDHQFEIHIDMGEDVLLWDEFDPNLYAVTLSIEDVDNSDVTEVFGMREITTQGRRVTVNGREIFLRGTLECCIFPKTGYPPVDVEEWRRICKIVKSYGLNHLRFHSYCPPEAAFVAADEAGIYLQIECSSWANQDSKIGDGEPIDEYIYAESERIINNFGNHPSFCFMAYGNEPGGEHKEKYLGEFLNYWKAKDKRKIYTCAAGWPLIEESQYHLDPNPRIQRWAEELNSVINKDRPNTLYDFKNTILKYEKPFVSHEIGQWCAYPDFSEIKKYTGVLQAKNFELFQESLENNGLGDFAQQFLMASGKLQTLCYKADIEAALRTPEFAGFQLLDLHDFPGQGTALVGVLNAFWEEKGYVTADEYRQFCNETVPLARLEKRVFTNHENLKAAIEVAHFGKDILRKTSATWSLVDINGRVLADGQLESRDILIDNCQELGNISVPMANIPTPQKLILEVTVANYTNSWDTWVYPTQLPKEDNNDIRVVPSLDHSTIQFLKTGGKVLLSLGKGKVSQENGGEVGVGFSSIFWSTYLTKGQKPHTLGILCDPNHKALSKFPTEYHSNWQWWDAVSHADVIMLDGLAQRPETIVRVIDDWFTNRDLALIFEVKVGKGKIIVSGTDLIGNLETRPEARQLRHSLISYMKGNAFNPTVLSSVEQLERIIK